MARMFGLNGMIRGRQGNNVFSVQNGTQVLKVYQPVVANPRSLPQRLQRAKFSLAGKMSGATPNGALLGMPGSSARARRASFVSFVAKNSSVTSVDHTLTATIPYSDVLYSIGSVARYSGAVTPSASWSGTDASSWVSVSVPAMSVHAAAPAGYGELVIAALYDAATSRLDEVQAAVRSTSSATTFQMRQGARRDVFVATYIAPYIVSNTLGAPSSLGLQGSETNVQLNVTSSSFLAGAHWGVSQFLGVSTLSTVAGLSRPIEGETHVSDPDTGDVMRSEKKK